MAAMYDEPTNHAWTVDKPLLPKGRSGRPAIAVGRVPDRHNGDS
jgi:hypothetical protein